MFNVYGLIVISGQTAGINAEDLLRMATSKLTESGTQASEWKVCSTWRY